MKIMNLKWVCPKCEKVILSTSKSQEIYNTNLHLEKHKNKEKESERKRQKKRRLK